MCADSKKKGDLLESIVAMLHEVSGVQVEKKVRLPTVNGRRRRREIDVLVSTSVVGYVIRIALECKNEKKRTGTERIDAFVGKLDDVGIARSQGIYVSAAGYTSGAIGRAAQSGVRPLVLDGLSSDRLGVAVVAAVQSTVLLVATWRVMSRFDDVADSDRSAPPLYVEADLAPSMGGGVPALLDLLWRLWITGVIPATIGEHHIFIRLPRGFRYGANEPPVESGIVIATVEVAAYVGTLSGAATNVFLRHAETEVVEKAKIEAKWDLPAGPLALMPFASEEALAAFLASRPRPHLSTRARVPRLVSDRVFWPPSSEAVQRIKELRAAGTEITFAEVEGNDLAEAWQPWVPSHSG